MVVSKLIEQEIFISPEFVLHDLKLYVYLEGENQRRCATDSSWMLACSCCRRTGL
jgi:hypothetical protein